MVRKAPVSVGGVVPAPPYHGSVNRVNVSLLQHRLLDRRNTLSLTIYDLRVTGSPANVRRTSVLHYKLGKHWHFGEEV